jgi:hypothetical protein
MSQNLTKKIEKMFEFTIEKQSKNFPNFFVDE